MTNKYLRLMRFDKPIGIYLLAYPVLWSLLLSNTADIKLWIIFLIGIVVMRAAGCVINDYVDRNIDGHVERTQTRPLITGEVSANNALILFLGLSCIALILILNTNILTMKLAIIAGALTIIYPFSKRFFPIPQLFLSIAFAMSIPMTFAASLEIIPLKAWLVFTTTIMWVIAYDTMYAMSDKPDDIKIKVKSSAIFFGSLDKIAIAILQTLTFTGLISIGISFTLHPMYYIFVFICLGLMIYHQYLIKNRDRVLCLKAFLHNTYIGLVITIGIAIDRIIF